MLETWFALLAFGALALAWSSARAAAERAREVAAALCRQANVQLLDQTVAIERIALRRGPDGRVRLWRRYRFDYSRAGEDRQRGGLALLGRQLVWMQAPEAAPHLASSAS